MILVDLAIAVTLALLFGALLVAALYGLAHCGVWLLERWRHPLPDADADRWHADDPNS